MTTKIGTDTPIRQDEPLRDKEEFVQGVAIGLRKVSGDGIWLIPYRHQFASLANQHFDSFDAYYHAIESIPFIAKGIEK